MLKAIKAKLEKGSSELDVDKIKTASGQWDLIDTLTKDYTQRSWSRMHRDIQVVTGLDIKPSTYLAQRACKVFGFWIELYSKGILSMSFEDFFSWMVLNKKVDLTSCSMREEQKKLYSILRDAGIITVPMNYVEVFNLVQFKEFQLGTNWVGTVRIETSKDKFHSMTMYNMNGDIKLSDISFRGTRVNPWKYVTPENFRYFTTFLLSPLT